MDNNNLKTFLMEHLIGFITVFGARYKRMLGNASWNSITMSHKEDSAIKNFVKFKANTLKAIEIYNQLYGNQNHRLVTEHYKVGNTKKYATCSSWQLKIDVITGEDSQDWANVYALTAKASQDGYMASVLYIDEAILVDGKLFMKSIAPFASRNGGSIIVTGIASTDATCLQSYVHNMPKAIKFIMTRDDVYRTMKSTHPKEAELYLSSSEELIMGMGGHNSTEAQTNYYMSWEIADGLYCTRSQLEKNKIYETEMGSINYSADYIVGGLDLSISNDYTVLTISEVYRHEYLIERYGAPLMQEGYMHYVKDFETFNLDRQRMDANVLAEKIADRCKKYKLQALSIDSTASQSVQVQLIYEAIQRLGINTLVVPFNFGGQTNKVTMVSYAESVMFSGRCKFPLEEYRHSHKSYDIFLDELISLKKEKQQGKQNVQYMAPKGKTDDHVFSCFLSLYCIPYVIKMRADNKLIEIGTKKIIPRLNKFKLLSEIEPQQYFDTYIDVPF